MYLPPSATGVLAGHNAHPPLPHPVLSGAVLSGNKPTCPCRGSRGLRQGGCVEGSARCSAPQPPALAVVPWRRSSSCFAPSRMTTRSGAISVRPGMLPQCQMPPAVWRDSHRERASARVCANRPFRPKAPCPRDRHAAPTPYLSVARAPVFVAATRSCAGACCLFASEAGACAGACFLFAAALRFCAAGRCASPAPCRPACGGVCAGRAPGGRAGRRTGRVRGVRPPARELGGHERIGWRCGVGHL